MPWPSSSPTHAVAHARARRAVPLSFRHAAAASAASAASSPATNRTATRPRSTGAASARSKAARTRMRSGRYLSMGCNHCVNPTCLSGCPVDAYTKDPVTGIVRHSADACIGCQYCTWNCSYGVPQYNPERGVVGKCDMCHGRLEHGQAPACVSACPEGAIADRDRQDRRLARRRGGKRRVRRAVRSTTKVCRRRASRCPRTCRRTRGRSTSRTSARNMPHWSLVMMTVLTQLSVGAFVTIWLLQLFGATDASRCRGADVAARGGARAQRRHPSPRPPGLRLPRAEDVAPVLAEPRGAAVHGVLRRRRALRGTALDGSAGQPGCRGADRRCSVSPASPPAPASIACHRARPGTRR